MDRQIHHHFSQMPSTYDVRQQQRPTKWKTREERRFGIRIVRKGECCEAAGKGDS
jgi:hypothetical protein